MIDGKNEIVPYTTYNGVRIRKFIDAAINAVEMRPHERGSLTLEFNIALGRNVSPNRIFYGKKFMNKLEVDNPKVYLFALGYFGEHNFEVDLSR